MMRIAALFTCAALLPTALAQHNRYWVTELVAPPGSSRALSVNNLGAACGYLGSSFQGGVGQYWSPTGQPTTLSAPQGSHVAPWDVNDLGVMTGIIGWPAEQFPAKWQTPGSYGYIPPAAQRGFASQTNSQNQTVGSTNQDRAFVYHPVTGISFIIPDSPIWGGPSYAYAINDSGVTVGVATYNGGFRAFKWTQASGAVALPTPGSSSPHTSGAVDISEDGWIVGSAYFQGSSPVVWDGSGNMIRLPELAPGATSEAINDSHFVVGNYDPPGIASMTGFLWSPQNGIVDFKSLVDNLGAWQTLQCFDINNSGTIVGQGFRNGQTRAFIAHVVPEPGTICGLLLGVGWLVRRRRRWAKASASS